MIGLIHAGIEALLTGDAPFVADMQALNLGSGGEAVAPQLLLALREPAQVPQQKYPAFLVEKGNADTEVLSDTGSEFSVIGFTQQGMATDVLIGVIWHQPTPETAYRQRMGLETAFVDLFLRHPDPGGATLAWVRRVDFDRGALHPTQTALVTVRVEYAQQRTAR